MDAPEQGDMAHFTSVPGAYLPGEDMLVRYQLQESYTTHARDWIALFRVGWTSKRDYYTFEWAPSENEDGKLTVKFSGSRLPHDDGNFYQFCYVSRPGDVVGSSRPFQFSKSARRSNSDELEMVEVEDDASLVLLRTRTDAQVMELEKKIAELTQKNVNVEDSFVQVRTEYQGIKVERDRASAQLEACNEQLQQANDHISELQTINDQKDKEIVQLKTDLAKLDDLVKELQAIGATKDEKMKELQDIYDQVEQALQGTTAENSQLQQTLANNEKEKDEQNAALAAANKAKKEESETELRMQYTTLEEGKEKMLSQSEYYDERLDQYVHAQLAALDQCVQEQKAQLAALQQQIDAQTEQLEKQGSDLQNAQEMLTAKEQELVVALQNICEVMGNIKEPRDILPPQPATDDKVDKSAIEALQRAYDDVQIRWKKNEKIIAHLKARVLELEEKVKLCHQEHVAVTESTELKRMQQQDGVGQGVNEQKAEVRKLEEEPRVFQEKHDQRIADKNDPLQKQQDMLDAKLNMIDGLEEQQRTMQTLIDALNKANNQLKQRILDTTMAPPTQHGSRHPQHQARSVMYSSRGLWQMLSAMP